MRCGFSDRLPQPRSGLAIWNFIHPAAGSGCGGGKPPLKNRRVGKRGEKRSEALTCFGKGIILFLVIL
jgi:hypothetical protein